MKKQNEIEKALKEMETRKSSYMLDMMSVKPTGIVYDTELIRKLEVTDATIQTLKWVLYTEKKPSDGKKKVK